MTLFKIFTIFVVFFSTYKLYIRFTMRLIDFKSFLSWLILSLSGGFFILFPGLSNYLSFIIGMGRGIDTAFLLAIILLFYINFKQYLLINKLDKQLTDLTINTSKEIYNLKEHE